jgi:uncharacterized protein (TIGR02588 family)
MMPPQRTSISWWEWAAAAVSAAIVAAAVVTLLLHARRERTPPDLTVAIDSIESVTAGFLVRFTVDNRGNTTAAQVPVHGELRGAGGREETAEIVFDYVPDGSRRRGGLMFRADPRLGQLTLHATGYREP